MDFKASGYDFQICGHKNSISVGVPGLGSYDGYDFRICGHKNGISVGVPGLGSYDGDAAQKVEVDIPRFRIWENEWFYMTRHPFSSDVKMNLKGCVHKTEQMGKLWGTKALTPAHYAEGLDDPKRTICLLKAWAIWRARRFDWATATPARERGLQKMLHECRDEILAADGRAVLQRPLFESTKAHKLLHMWVPDLVARVLP